MRRCIIITGFKSNLDPVSIYTGLSGVDAEEAALEAAKTGKYSYIGKLQSPNMIPLPVDPTPTTATGAPVVEVPQPAPLPPSVEEEVAAIAAPASSKNKKNKTDQ